MHSLPGGSADRATVDGKEIAVPTYFVELDGRVLLIAASIEIPSPGPEHDCVVEAHGQRWTFRGRESRGAAQLRRPPAALIIRSVEPVAPEPLT
jgi:hypothetical protein